MCNDKRIATRDKAYFIKKSSAVLICILFIFLALLLFSCEKKQEPTTTYTPIAQFSFSLRGDSYAILEYLGTDTEVSIPTEVNGVPITVIGDSAFYGNTTITKLTVNEGVKILENAAFSRMSELKEIYLPASLTTMGPNPFSENMSLRKIVVPDESQYFKTVSGHLYSKNGEKLLAYADGLKLTTFEIPEGTKILSPYSMYLVQSVSKIIIPASLTTIQLNAIKGTILDDFIVNEKNTMFCSVDGVVFSKDMKTLIAVPSSKSQFVIPDTVTKLAYQAFCYNSATAMTVPSSVTEIGDYCFESSALSTLFLPKETLSIGESAFFRSYNLERIYVDEDNPNFYADTRALFSKDKKTLIAYFIKFSSATYTIPEGVTTIQRSSFYGANTLENLIFPTTLTRLQDEAIFGDVLKCFIFKAIEPPRTEELSLMPVGTYYFVVPDDSFDTYKGSENWEQYENNLFTHTEATEGGLVSRDLLD